MENNSVSLRYSTLLSLLFIVIYKVYQIYTNLWQLDVTKGLFHLKLSKICAGHITSVDMEIVVT